MYLYFVVQIDIGSFMVAAYAFRTFCSRLDVDERDMHFDSRFCREVDR